MRGTEIRINFKDIELVQITYLVCRVRAEDIQWRGDQLRFDRDGFGALSLACPQSLLDGVDAGGGVASEFNVGTELDRLGRQSTRDRAEQDVADSGLHWRGQRCEHRIGLATAVS